MNRPYTPRPIEIVARETIQGLTQDIEGYINPTNDSNLAAWMMAKTRAENIVEALTTACNELAKRPALGAGQLALRAIATCTPEEDEAFEALSARQQEARVFQQLLAPMRGAM